MKLDKTALNQDWTYRISLTDDLDVQSPASYGHDLLTCKSSRSRSVGSEDTVQANGRTEAIALPAALTRSVTIQAMIKLLC